MRKSKRRRILSEMLVMNSWFSSGRRVTTRLLAAGGEDRDVRKMDYLSPIDAPVAADDGRRDVRWSSPRMNTEGEKPDSVCDLISV